MDATQLLHAINTAIVALTEGGASSYSIGQRSVTKIDLDSLFRQRNDLLWQIAREQNAGRALAKMGRVRP
jgi:uncharacterized membrane protein YfbV (UPF0208 family)